VSGSGVIWAICKCEPWHRRITTPTSHHSVSVPATEPTESKHWRHDTRKSARKQSIKKSKVLGCSSSQHSSLLRELTCHMQSHPAEVTFPPLAQPIKAAYSIGKTEMWVTAALLLRCRGIKWKLTKTHFRHFQPSEQHAEAMAAFDWQYVTSY